MFGLPEVTKGQPYNAETLFTSNKKESPAVTLLVISDIADADNLEFQSFRSAVGAPKYVVGKNLILLLAENNTLLSVNSFLGIKAKQKDSLISVSSANCLNLNTC
jgi:hypothetical protein